MVTAVASDPAGNVSLASPGLSVLIEPPVQAAIDALGFGNAAGLDAELVRADILAGNLGYEQFVSQLISDLQDTAVPALVVTAILSNVRPTEAHLSDLVSFTATQFAAYQALGVARPELGPYEALGVGFSESAAFRASYEGMDDVLFSETAYTLVFSRPPTLPQIEHFNSQIAYFEEIYQNAGLGSAESDLRAKGAAIGQMIGHAVLDEPNLHAFDDAAILFLRQAAAGQANFGDPIGLI